MRKWSLILDFDSTIITKESFDVLSEIILSKNLNSDKITYKIKELTRLGMEGEITFQESLTRRLELLNLTQEYIAELSRLVLTMVSPSFCNKEKWFRENADDIFIFSGGFRDVVTPVAKILGMRSENIYANDLIFKDGNFQGIDDNNPLSKSCGKLNLAKLLKLNTEIIMVGDGITDAEVKQLDKEVTFFAFTENVHRETVINIADYVADDFNDILVFIDNLK
ncbi:MAG: hypothetical protein CMG60_01430 [Candidatus Marinimicrobia bacterium]|nr:hypothetical protein [Candidatus Neomarinimicrobiota bacterium]